MPLSNKKHRAELRAEIAERVSELRREKRIWSPGAPRADLRCRRPLELVVLERVHGRVSLEDLVDAAKQNGREAIDLGKVGVHLETQDVPWEDFTVEVAVLTTEVLASDESYAGYIGGLWVEYKRALQVGAGNQEKFSQYLALKAQFEPA